MMWEDQLFDDMKQTCPATYARLKKQKKVFNEAYFKVFYPIMKVSIDTPVNMWF